MEKKEYEHNTIHNSFETNIEYNGKKLKLVTKRDENKPHIFNHSVYHDKSGMKLKPHYYTELSEVKNEVLSEEHLEQILNNHKKTYKILKTAIPKMEYRL